MPSIQVKFEQTPLAMTQPKIISSRTPHATKLHSTDTLKTPKAPLVTPESWEAYFDKLARGVKPLQVHPADAIIKELKEKDPSWASKMEAQVKYAGDNTYLPSPSDFSPSSMAGCHGPLPTKLHDKRNGKNYFADITLKRPFGEIPTRFKYYDTYELLDSVELREEAVLRGLTVMDNDRIYLLKLLNKEDKTYYFVKKKYETKSFDELQDLVQENNLDLGGFVEVMDRSDLINALAAHEGKLSCIIACPCENHKCGTSQFVHIIHEITILQFQEMLGLKSFPVSGMPFAIV